MATSRKSTSSKAPSSRKASAPRERKGIQSVEVGVRVVDALSHAEDTLPLGEVGRLAGISASQAHRYLTSFAKSGLVYQDAATGRYGLGPQALRWGVSAMSKTDVIEISAQALNELCARLDLTGLLCIWGDRGPTCVRMRRSAFLLGTDLGLGSIMPLLTSATGHVYLAHLPTAMTRELTQAETALARKQGQAIDMRAVAAMCAEVRRSGLAQEQGHYVARVSAIAAPVFDHQGNLAAVMTLLMRRVPGTTTAHADLAEELVQATQAVSRSLGWKGSTGAKTT